MKAKRLTAGFLLIALSIVLSSCDALLNPSSMFESWDKPDVDKIAGMNGQNLLDALEDQDGSQKFYDDLSDNQIAEIDGKLADLEQSGDADTASEAALARVELQVKTDATVNDAVNCVTDIIADLAESESADSATLDTAIAAMTGALSSIKDDKAALVGFLDSMSTIAGSYEIVTTGDVDGGDLQTYMVAAVFDTLVAVYTPTGGTTADGEALAAAALMEYLDKGDSAVLDDLMPAGDSTKFEELLTEGADTKADTIATLAALAGLPTLGEKLTGALEE